MATGNAATVAFRVNHAVLESIAHIAAQTDRTVSGAVRILIAEALEHRGLYPPKDKR
jgi:hypothetical protein